MSAMAIASPRMVQMVTGEDISMQDLGGAHMHAAESGSADLVARDEEHARELVADLITYLPDKAHEKPPRSEPKAPKLSPNGIDEVIPSSPNRAYDMTDLIDRVVDSGSFFELRPEFGGEIITAFAKIDGRPVGIVANQPAHLAGTLDIDASVKGARFVRFCDAFNIPLVTFEDVPGFLPGVAQEYGGIIRHGAKLLFAFAEATVPKLTVITRKAYGGAYCVMSSKHLRTDVNYAWPTAEIAVMGPEGAVNILYRRELEQAEDAAALRARKVAEYRERLANPFAAASRGFVDEVIAPRHTRRRLIAALAALSTKRDRNPPKKHGNIPL